MTDQPDQRAQNNADGGREALAPTACQSLPSQIVRLSDRFAATCRRLAELEARLNARLAEVNRRERALAEREARLRELEEQLRQRRAEPDAQGSEASDRRPGDGSGATQTQQAKGGGEAAERAPHAGPLFDGPPPVVDSAALGAQPVEVVLPGDREAAAGEEQPLPADLTPEEQEKLRVLRRLAQGLSDAELIARIRAERGSHGRQAPDGGKRRRRRWWR